MRRRSRTRRVLKWGFTVFATLSSVLWIVSGFYSIGWRSHAGRVVLLDSGLVTVWWISPNDVNVVGDIRAARSSERAATGRPYLIRRHFLDEAGYNWDKSFFIIRAYPARFGLRERYHVVRAYRSLRGVICPLWMTALIAVVPVALLWWLDRPRFPRGHCQTCGYNLTGNVSGRCPECGETVQVVK